ncbi:hypothetical protein P8605_41040, partial [Streptomyces sp. T-3]|nr:hypothetical protein [Streptomyces sp. T-3]
WQEPLRPVLAAATARFPGLRAHCRAVYARTYAEDIWLTRIERLYAELCAPAVPPTRRGVLRGVRA